MSWHTGLYKFDDSDKKDFHHDVVEHEPTVVNTVFTSEKPSHVDTIVYWRNWMGAKLRECENFNAGYYQEKE